MSDVFISYSRKDIQFAQRIHHELEARDREPWVDWQDIPPTSEWLDEVYAGIQAAIEYGPARIPHRAIEAAVQPLRDIRDKVGMDLDILVDGHAHFHLPAALRIAEALREVQPLWLEDVIKMDNLDTVADFRRQSRMPISVSEMLLSRADYNSVLMNQAADYVMIDPTWVGAFRRLRGLPISLKPTMYQSVCTIAPVR